MSVGGFKKLVVYGSICYMSIPGHEKIDCDEQTHAGGNCRLLSVTRHTRERKPQGGALVLRRRRVAHVDIVLHQFIQRGLGDDCAANLGYCCWGHSCAIVVLVVGRQI